MKRTVFYSWQSDIKAAANRSLIQTALEDAAEEIAADGTIDVEPVIDRDTANVPGSPDIGVTILNKIQNADLVVADVTIINSGSNERPTPNPNVLIEVGYALATHSESGLLLVQNTAFGGPELLPFDLRQKRVVSYDSPVDSDDRATPRRKLRADLRRGIEAVLRQRTAKRVTDFPMDLRLGYKAKSIAKDLHVYQLRVALKNTGARRIGQWHVAIDLPRALLTKEQFQKADRELSNKQRAIFRFDEKTSGVIYPDASKMLAVEYRIDESLFKNQPQVLNDSISVRAYVEDQRGEPMERPVRELQNY